MMALELLRWWYGRGWQLMIMQAGRRFNTLGTTFSVNTLLRTLFSPWRRIISYPGAGLDARLRALVDNLVSRSVGFVVRFFVLLAVAILGIFVLAFGLLQIIVWPVVPLLAIAPIVKVAL
jgi:hypothetical protein